MVKSFMVLYWVIFMLSFSVLVATPPSAAPISLFCPICNPPLPLHLCGSLCQWIFCFFYNFQLILHHVSALSINPALLSLFPSGLLGLFFSGLLGLFFSLDFWDFCFLDFWDFSFLDFWDFWGFDFLHCCRFFSLGTFPDLDFPIRSDLGWVEILLLLLLWVGFWGELEVQGEAQWSPTSLASLYECLPVAIKTY